MKSFLSLILFGLFTSGLFSQTGTEVRVTGTVTDMSGMPLPGVNVIVKGSSSGTSTDFDGLFSLDVPSSSTLVFSYLGFQTQEITVNGAADLNVQLVEDTSTLDEVVVVGYG
ncbi:MAG: carboxypeptidase-like regulatory domain-containing protein, partial [Bacteroidota bacterium]|nr:carboxypeptidase-like regulatory domain-containing protein [Bacteroidota bacterium]